MRVLNASLCLLCVLTLGAAPATQTAVAPAPRFVDDRLVLTAEQSSGGKIMTGSDGKLIGVTLDKSCAANFKNSADACIEWKLESPLPEGWWRGTVKSNLRPGYANRDFGIMLMSAAKPSVTIAPNFVNYDKDKPQIFEFWIYTSSPFQSVRIQPISDLWNWNNTWPVSQITLEHKTPGALEAADAVTLDLPVQPDRSVRLSLPLPTGNWSMGGSVKSEVAASFVGQDGKSVQVPLKLDRYKRPLTSYAYMASPLRQISFPPAGAPKSILIRHNVSRTPTSFATEEKAMVTVDEAKTQSAELVMIGAGQGGELPAIPLLPRDQHNAVLTTWDDGKPEDMRCAEILSKHGYHPTFFLNQNAPALKFLDKLEGMGAEIGSHCYHHPSLYSIAPQEAIEECTEMRKLLEKELKHPVISFAYPNGYSPAYDVEGDYVLRAVKAAGYWSGRTTMTKSHTVETYTDLAAMETDGFFGYAKELEQNWTKTKAVKGGVLYFWGHSWQIGKTDEQWKKFEDFVAKFAKQPDTWYPSQGDFSVWLWMRKNVQIAAGSRSGDRVTLKLSRPWLHPYLAERCPLSLTVPQGVTKVLWQGKEVPAVNGVVELEWVAQ